MLGVRKAPRPGDSGYARLAAIAVLVALATLWPCAARAHAVGLSRGEYVVRDRTIAIAITLARSDATTFASAEDLARTVRIASGDAPCGMTSATYTDAPPDGLSLRATYDCPTAPTRVTFDVGFLSELPFGHRHLVHAFSARDRSRAIDDVLTREHRSFDVPVDASPTASSGSPGVGARSAPTRSALSLATSLVRMGVEHIWTGYDHLLFLLGLVLASRSVRSLLGVVTAFTLAHSITLGVSALGLWAPPPSVVEPLIAASIAYVGVENLLAREIAARWRLTFAFGLVHGFGFAGALREVHFDRESVPLVLASFNVGVELGQLAVLAAVVPLVFALRRQRWFQSTGTAALNGAVALAGLGWTVVRVFGVAT